MEQNIEKNKEKLANLGEKFRKEEKLFSLYKLCRQNEKQTRKGKASEDRKTKIKNNFIYV